MSDRRLRELRRLSFEGGVEEEAAYLRERVRVGYIKDYLVCLAARCGDAAARLVHPELPTITDWTTQPSTPELRIRVLLIACTVIQPIWNREVRLRDPTSWLEQQGGKYHQWFDDEHHRQLILEVSLWSNGIKHEKTMAVPASAQVREYPAFYASEHWRALVKGFRRELFLKDIHLQVNQETRRVLQVIQDFLDDKNPNLQAYVSGGTAPETLEIGWAYHLMCAPWSPDTRHFVDCLAECHRYIIKPELTEIINKEISAWALA